MQLRYWGIIGVVAAALIVLGIANWLFRPKIVVPVVDSTDQPAQETQDPIVAAQAANSAGLSSQAAEQAQVTAQQNFSHVYTSAQYGFSFNYPDSLKIGTNVADDATTILAQDVGSHVGFQIYITAWSGGEISANEIAQELPQVDMQNPKQVTIGGVPAITFFATDPNFGQSAQAWFVYKKHLYQISTYQTQAPLLGKVLSTWKFN